MGGGLFDDATARKGTEEGKEGASRRRSVFRSLGDDFDVVYASGKALLAFIVLLFGCVWALAACLVLAWRGAALVYALHSMLQTRRRAAMHSVSWLVHAVVWFW